MDVAFHAATVEVVLHDVDGHVLDAQGPVVDRGVDGFLQSDGGGDTALVKNHVGAGDGETLVAVFQEAFRHHDGDLLDKEARPGIVGIELRDGEVGFVVAGGELHLRVVHLHRQVERDVGGLEGPARQVLVLEGVHGHRGIPVAPVFDHAFHKDFGLLALEALAVVVALDEVGNLHFRLHREHLQFVVLPVYHAAVFGLLLVLRGQELDVEVRLRVVQRQVLKQDDIARGGQDAVGVHTGAWCPEDEDVLLGDVVVGQRGHAEEVEPGTRGLPFHRNNLDVDGRGVDLLWQLQGQEHLDVGHVAVVAVHEIVIDGEALAHVVVVFRGLHLAGQAVHTAGNVVLVAFHVAGQGLWRGTADEVVQAPFGEDVVGNPFLQVVRVGQVVFQLPGAILQVLPVRFRLAFHCTGIHDVVAVDGDTLELHAHLHLLAEGRPQHPARTAPFPGCLLHVLAHFHVVFTHVDHLALHVSI